TSRSISTTPERASVPELLSTWISAMAPPAGARLVANAASTRVLLDCGVAVARGIVLTHRLAHSVDEVREGDHLVGGRRLGGKDIGRPLDRAPGLEAKVEV